MHRKIHLLAVSGFLSWFAGCQTSSTTQSVNPQFSSTTLAMYGSLKFDRGGNSVIGEVRMRHDEPGKFEMIVTKGPTITFCHLLADGERWHIDFPAENRSLSGQGTPGNEELALWIETHRMVAMAIKRAQNQQDFTETLRGEYKSGRLFHIEMSEFRKLLDQSFPTRMRLTCHGCKSSIEIVVHQLK